MRTTTPTFLWLLLLAIPVTVSLSWVLGGELVATVSPLELSIGRLGLGTIAFFFVSNIVSTQKALNVNERLAWWGQQFLLSITGRAAYYALTSTALLSISPLEALIMTSLMPVIAFSMERLLGKVFFSWKTPVFGLLASFFVVAALVVRDFSKINTLKPLHYGHGLMALGIAAYVLHMALYARLVKDKNPANPLFAQFLIGFLLLIPFEPQALMFMKDLNALKWVHFLIYALICNIIPFVAVHFCLKHFDSFKVSTVSILSPLFGTFFALAYGSPLPSSVFFILTGAACMSVYLCLKSNVMPAPDRFDAAGEHA